MPLTSFYDNRLRVLLDNHMAIDKDTVVRVKASGQTFQGKIIYVDDFRQALILMENNGDRVLIPYKKISWIKTFQTQDASKFP
ncbi:MAG: hypothetical protein QXP16_03875 [Candidatus Bathyarchaeia archaeon]